MIGNYLHLLSPILIVEDNPEIQYRIESIMNLLGYSKKDLYFTQTISQAIQVIENKKIKLFFINLYLPDGDGLDLIKIIREDLRSDIPIMVISEWNTLESVYQALENGADGYILKEKEDNEIRYSIETLLKGEVVVGTYIAKRILQKIQQKNIIDRKKVNSKNKILSNREMQILEFIENGFSSKEIGERIHISKFTVNVHIRNIFQKLNVNSRTKAIYTARSEGLLD